MHAINCVGGRYLHLVLQSCVPNPFSVGHQSYPALINIISNRQRPRRQDRDYTIIMLLLIAIPLMMKTTMIPYYILHASASHVKPSSHVKSRVLQNVESDASDRHFCAVFMPYGRRKFNEQSKSSLWCSEEILIGRKVSRIHRNYLCCVEFLEPYSYRQWVWCQAVRQNTGRLLKFCTD